MFIWAIFRLFFIISALFLLLAFGLGLSLFWRVMSGLRRGGYTPGQEAPPRQNYSNGGNIIEGEYKVLEETKKE